MDFKVAGTRTGITALQMDIKIGGLTRQILEQAMEQARLGRLFLLDKMDAVLDGPRTERSKYAPRIETVMIPTDKIRDLIGKGGATIRGIVEQTGAKIDVDDTGRVSVASSDAEGLKKALAMISDITAVPEIGKIYLGKVVRLAEFGAFVELFPGTDGLLHISEIAEHRVKEVKDELREGDQVMVKVLAIEGNRIKLSRKALIKEQKAKLAAASPQAAATPQAAAAETTDGHGEPSAPPPPRPQRPVSEFDERQPRSNQSTILIEGGDDFDEEEGEEFDEENEPNFNRAEGAPVAVGANPAPGGTGRPPAAGGGGDNNRRRRRRRGGRPPGGGGRPGGGGGHHS
jgi:polyribonucleotide nucleotidyltransferase